MARDGAALLTAATDRLGHLLVELRGADGSLRSCGAAGVLYCERAEEVAQRGVNHSFIRERCQSSARDKPRSLTADVLGQWTGQSPDAISQSIAAIEEELLVDGYGLRAVIEHAREAIAFAGNVAPHFGLASLRVGF